MFACIIRHVHVLGAFASLYNRNFIMFVPIICLLAF